MCLHEVPIQSLMFNPFLKMENQWMIIAAGNEKNNNLMTASWGMYGMLWRKYMFQIYIRPQRYTKILVDNTDRVTLSFLPEKYRKAMQICGTISGRDKNKWEESGLHPYYLDGTIAVKEAELIIVGQKQYTQWFDPNLFVSEDNIIRCYPEKDYHQMYMYEVKKILSV